MKRKFMMLFAFLLMTGFGLCLIDANNEKNVKKEDQIGITDVVVDENFKDEDNPIVLEETSIKVDDQKTNKNDTSSKTTSVNKITSTKTNKTTTKITNSTTKLQSQTTQKNDTINKTTTVKDKTINQPKEDISVTKKENAAVKEEPKKEVTPPKETKPVTYNYDIGNCGKLYDSEAKAYAAAEAKFNDFSDPDKYVSNYMVYSTYDKWSINYYYEYY